MCVFNFFARTDFWEFFHTKNEKRKKTRNCILLFAFASLFLCENLFLRIFHSKNDKWYYAKLNSTFFDFASLFLCKDLFLRIFLAKNDKEKKTQNYILLFAFASLFLCENLFLRIFSQRMTRGYYIQIAFQFSPLLLYFFSRTLNWNPFSYLYNKKIEVYRF